MTKVSDYLDFRAFLKDALAERKARYPHFSLRLAAQKLGINASTLLRIVQGSRNLSDSLVIPLANLLKLGKRDTIYFELVVKFNQAKTPADKKVYFEALIPYRNPSGRLLLADSYELFENWHCIAIRELLHHHEFRGDYEELGQLLTPPISSKEAKAALGVLTRLKLITVDRRGVYRPSEKTISVGEDWRSLAIASFQKVTAGLAAEAIDRFAPDDRDISTLTVSLSAEALARVKERIRSMRKEILEIEAADREADRVYHVNVHIFPLTKSTKKAGS